MKEVLSLPRLIPGRRVQDGQKSGLYEVIGLGAAAGDTGAVSGLQLHKPPHGLPQFQRGPRLPGLQAGGQFIQYRFVLAVSWPCGHLPASK